MGNDLPLSAEPMAALSSKYTKPSKDPHQALWVLHHIETGEQRILKQLTTNEEPQSKRLQQLASQKKKDDNPYVLRLEDFMFVCEKNYCSTQYKSYLIFEKPFKDLRTEMNERQTQQNSFDADELMSVIETGALGLKYLRSINHPHLFINSTTLLLSSTGIILLSDPWVNDSNPYLLLHNYPSPEVLELGYKSKREEMDWVASGLFSLGLVVLELYYLRYMDDLYESNQDFNMGLLRSRVEGIKYPEVRKAVEELVSTKRKRLLIIPEMEKYVNANKNGGNEVQAESNVIYNRIPESNISKPGVLIKQHNSPARQKKIAKPDSTQIYQRRGAESPPHEGLIAVSPQRFNRVEYQPQYQKYHTITPTLYIPPTQSQYVYTSQRSFEQTNTVPVSPKYSNLQIYNSVELNKERMGHYNYQQMASPRYKQSQNTFQPASLVFSKTASNHPGNTTYNSPSIMSLSNFNHSSNGNFIRQSPNHFNYVPGMNMSGSQNIVTSFNAHIGQSMNSNTSNRSINSLGSYPKTLNQSIYQQDHYMQPKYTPNPNLLPAYLPSQIIHTSAVSQIPSEGTVKHLLNPIFDTTQGLVSKEVSDLMECSFRSPIGIVDQHSSIDEGKMLNNQQDMNLQSRNKSDDEYLLREESGENRIKEAIEKEKREIEATGKEGISKNNILEKPEESEGKNEKEEEAEEESSNQNQVSSSPPPTIRARQMNSTIIQVSDSENKSECLGEVQYNIGSSNVSNKFQIDSQRFVIEHYGQGARYQGQKFNGKKHGEGKYVYQDGAYVQGLWKNDQLNGPAKLYYSNGKLAYDGQYYKGEFHGYGKVYNAEPQSIGEGGTNYEDFSTMANEWEQYQGQIKQEEKDGFGRLRYSNGDVYEGEFKRDRVDGKGIFFMKSGGSIKGVWRNNKLVEII